MRIGIDLDDVVAECAVPYLRAFAERFRLDLPEEDLGWQTLSRIEEVSGEEKDRFRIALYDGKFFSELEPYEDCPEVVERIADAGHFALVNEIYARHVPAPAPARSAPIVASLPRGFLISIEAIART